VPQQFRCHSSSGATTVQVPQQFRCHSSSGAAVQVPQQFRCHSSSGATAVQVPQFRCRSSSGAAVQVLQPGQRGQQLGRQGMQSTSCSIWIAKCLKSLTVQGRGLMPQQFRCRSSGAAARSARPMALDCQHRSCHIVLCAAA